MGCKCVVGVSGNQVTMESSQSGPAATSTPTSSKSRDALDKKYKFTFDYSYWSHNPSDAHFVDQDQVMN